MRKQPAEMVQLLPVWELSKQKQVYGLFKTETFFFNKSADNVLDVHAAVIELSFAGNHLAVLDDIGMDLGNFSQAGQDSLAVDVAEPSFHFVFAVELRIDRTVLHALFGQRNDIRSDIRKLIVRHVQHSFSKVLVIATLPNGKTSMITPVMKNHKNK